MIRRIPPGLEAAGPEICFRQQTMKSSCSICEGYHDEENSSRPRSRCWTRDMVPFPRPTPGRIPLSAPRSQSPSPSGQNPPRVAISHPFLSMHFLPTGYTPSSPVEPGPVSASRIPTAPLSCRCSLGDAEDASRIKSARNPPPRAPSPSATSAVPAWETARTADSPASRPSGPGPRRPAPGRPASPATAWVRPRCS